MFGQGTATVLHAMDTQAKHARHTAHTTHFLQLQRLCLSATYHEGHAYAPKVPSSQPDMQLVQAAADTLPGREYGAETGHFVHNPAAPALYVPGAQSTAVGVMDAGGQEYLLTAGGKGRERGRERGRAKEGEGGQGWLLICLQVKHPLQKYTLMAVSYATMVHTRDAERWWWW